MPTYQNDNLNVSYLIIGIDGNSHNVEYGDIIETYRYLNLPGLTKTLDTPYYNPTKAVHSVTSTGVGDDQTIVTNDNTDKIEIYNGSVAEITLFLQSSANTPGLKIPVNAIRTIEGLLNRCAQIVLQFSEAVTAGVIVTELS